MDSEENVFDTVKFEKMKAVARYNRFRKMKKLLQVFEILVALTLISWSSTYLPQAFKVSCDFFFQLSGYVIKPRVVFVIGNAIIVALVVLCREIDAGHDHNSGSGDLYEDYVRHTQPQPQPEVVPLTDVDKNTHAPPVAEETNVPGVFPPNEKQLVHVAVVEKRKQVKEEKPEIKKEKLEQKEQPEKTVAVATAIEYAPKEIQKFQRTQSVRLKKEIASVPRLELRRSETYRRGVSSSLESFDDLSNEEFNYTVAAFIKRHQQSLMKQKLEEKDEF